MADYIDTLVGARRHLDDKIRGVPEAPAPIEREQLQPLLTALRRAEQQRDLMQSVLDNPERARHELDAMCTVIARGRARLEGPS